MKIAALPQVEFDDYPTDESTKICIFTQPRYPVPDLSHMLKEGRKLSLYCTQTTVCTIARFAKKLPFELFRLLPNQNEWLSFNSNNVDGLNTQFGVACLPTGSISDSVMLLILLDENPKRLILYTGQFRKCREVLISNLFSKYKRKITDVYVDNALANSRHMDAIQSISASNDIKKIIEKYPNYEIRLQMGLFDGLDLLVDLAHRHRINIKLDLIQQIFFYKSPYKDLFEYDNVIPRAEDLNKNFKFGNERKITITPIEAVDINEFIRYFQEEKVIHIRLIAKEQETNLSTEDTYGLIYVKYAAHASALTLCSLFHEIQPKRVHPIFEYELDDISMSSIPKEILPEFCEIVHDYEQVGQHHEVTSDDLNQTPAQRSFLNPTTILSGSITSNELSVGSNRSNLIESSKDSLTNTSIVNVVNTNNVDRVDKLIDISCEIIDVTDEIIDISDDEPVTVDAMVNGPSRKRLSFNSIRKSKSKRFKSTQTNHNRNENAAEVCNCQSEKRVSNITSTDSNERIEPLDNMSSESDSSSECVLVFPGHLE